MLREQLSKSIDTGFLDKLVHSQKAFRPELLTNDSETKKKVLTTIVRELEGCEEFWFSVAFATTSGVATLLNTLIELKERGVKGKILVSQYLNFTQPEALRRLNRIGNIELRIATEGNYHSKGYLFKRADLYTLIIGSSNLTQTALCTNKELNLKITATDNSELVASAIEEFKKEFDNAEEATESLIFKYSEIYQARRIADQRVIDEVLVPQPVHVFPNKMQRDALENISKLRDEGKVKALLISATGTGKTYLSAFDVQRVKPKKFLFVVHRRIIALEAMRTFKSLLGLEIKMDIYTGLQQELVADYLFATIQTISKPEHLNRFVREEFDYIVIDESHRAGADSYKRIIDYFRPGFLLGMTATPERTDATNVFELFDFNIAYEIRLHQALAEQMLSPFHYYGVTDLSIDGRQIEDTSEFNLLTSNERVDRIVEKINLYGTDTGIINGLIFCSRVDECILLSELFNRKGFRTLALTGDSSEEERSEAIARLECSTEPEKLDYIFTVDIFNEGVDIPKVNQLIMLRPTQSAIVFVQQLGRGLRKTESKDYLTVIDFIGNYSNNYLVPVALYGDTSFNKDKLRKLIASGSREMPGASTINFDRIAKERIFESIDSANMQTRRELVKEFRLLEYAIGRIPLMIDFLRFGARDPMHYVRYSKSYFNFVSTIYPEVCESLGSRARKMLELFSCEINNGKRVEESIILSALIEEGSIEVDRFKEEILQKYGYRVSDETVVSSLANLNFEFVTERSGNSLKSVRDIYKIDFVKIENGVLRSSNQLKELLATPVFKQYLFDSTECAILIFDELFSKSIFIDGFMLYQKYSRKDVFRILNWKQNPVAQNVGGYIVSDDETNCPLFVNYHKEADISETTKYEDGFLNQYEFSWMSKSRRTLESRDVRIIQRAKIRLPLFIKKNNDEGIEFYFMGDVSPRIDSFEQTVMESGADSSVPVVKILFEMKEPVDIDIYNYLSNIH